MMDKYGEPKWVGKMAVRDNDPIGIGVLVSRLVPEDDLVYIDQDDRTIVLSCDEIDKCLDKVTRAQDRIEKIRTKAKRGID
jgi:hypothetical protein